MYQVCWQRLLFAAFGSDLTSTTIVVSAFMAGLGAGALLGGWLADQWPSRALSIFCLFEIAIGLFGLTSPALLDATGDRFVSANLPTTALVNFALVLWPTLLMGATLPILVSLLARNWKNVGRSTGHLYAVNTLGAAFGALLPAFVLFGRITLDHTIYLAAVLNFSTAVGAYLLMRRHS